MSRLFRRKCGLVTAVVSTPESELREYGAGRVEALHRVEYQGAKVGSSRSTCVELSPQVRKGTAGPALIR